MRVTRLTLGSAVLLLMVACGRLPFFWKTEPLPAAGMPACEGADPEHAELELRNIQYDGDTLSGSLLIGAVGGSLCLDKRLIPGVEVRVDWVWDCSLEISNPVPFMRLDYASSPPREEDVLVLEPGYWYGAPVRLPLFPREQPTGKSNPDCVEVSLSLLPVGGAPAGRVRVRASRAPSALIDAGTMVEPQPSTDAGIEESP